MSSYIEVYKEIKQLLKKIQNKDFFSKFSAKDLFYIMDEKSRGILLFSDHMYQDGYGVQLFLNTSGLNYLHDLLSSEEPSAANYFYSDCHFLAFVPRKDLLPDDLQFLKDNKIRINEEKNLIPIRFKEGYGKSIMSKSDLLDSLNFLYYAYAIITNEKEELSLAFDNELSPIAIFDNKKMEYSCHYSGLPKLEQMPKKRKANTLIVDDLKDLEFVDDICYFFHSYLPVKVTDKEPFKTIVLAYYLNSKQYSIELFDVEPNKIDQSFFGFIDEVFNTYGKPLTVLFNHRNLYSISCKTFNKLDVECKYAKEHGKYDKMIFELILEHVMKTDNLDSNTDILDDEEQYLSMDEDEEIYIS